MRTVSVICGLLCPIVLSGCRERLLTARAQTPEQYRQVVAVSGTDTITLSYVCGTIFRVTSTQSVPHEITWQTVGSTPVPDTLVKKLPGQALGETFITAVSSDTIRIVSSSDPTIDLSEANGGTPPCIPSRDTTWVQDTDNEYRAKLDRSVRFGRSDPRDSIFGKHARVHQNFSSSKQELATALAIYNARVVSRLSFNFAIIYFDNAPTSIAGYDSLLATMETNPAISLAQSLYFKDSHSISRSGTH